MKNSEIFNELEKRFKRDQELSKSGFDEKYVRNCKDNAEWLKKVLSNYGWPSEEKVGKKGENYAWLIAQHSDHDTGFQKQILDILEKLPRTSERKQHIAYLKDRIRVSENKKQVYGTQFREGEVWPIENRDEVDKRRAEMNLEPLNQYIEEYNKMREDFGLD